MRDTSESDTDRTRRQFLEEAGTTGAAATAYPLSHSGGGDGGILASIKDSLSGGPDLVVMHNGEVVTEDPKELNFEGSGIKEVTVPNDYDGVVRITLDGGATVDGERIEPVTVATSELSNTDHGRPWWSVQDKTITIGSTGDYSSLSAALDNEWPWLIRHQLTFDIASGYDMSTEDVYVPPAVVNRKSISRDTESIAVEFAGDETNRPLLNSMLLDTVLGMGISVKGIEFTGGDSISDEDASFQAYGCRGRVQFANCAFSGTNSKGLIAYSSDVTVGGSSTDIGTALAGDAFQTKHMGNIFVTSDITGTAGRHLLNADSGEISVDPAVAPVSASASSSNTRHAVDHNGIVREHYVTDISTQRENVSLSGGAIDIQSQYMRLAAESGTSDTLTTINGGQEGLQIVLECNNDTITVDSGTDNVLLETTSFDLSNNRDKLVLMNTPGDIWVEVSRANNN